MALKVLDRCEQVITDKLIPYNFYVIPMAEAYIKAGRADKGKAILSRLLERTSIEMDYFFRFEMKDARNLDSDKRQDLYVANKIKDLSAQYNLSDLNTKATQLFNKWVKIYEATAPQQQQQQMPQQQEGE